MQCKEKRLGLVSFRLAVALLAFLALLPACVTSQELSLNSTGSGKVDFFFKLNSELKDTFIEMSELMDESLQGNEESLFNLEEIRNDFSTKVGITLIDLQAPSFEELTGQFRYSDANAIFQHANGSVESKIIQFRNQGDVRDVRLYLDRDSFQEVKDFFPMLDNPLFDMLGPMANENITEDEYYELVGFVLGEEGIKGIKESVFDITLKVDGQIVDHEGGTQVGNTITYRIPLIKLLLLHEPLSYSLRFKV